MKVEELLARAGIEEFMKIMKQTVERMHRIEMENVELTEALWLCRVYIDSTTPAGDFLNEKLNGLLNAKDERLRAPGNVADRGTGDNSGNS